MSETTPLTIKDKEPTQEDLENRVETFSWIIRRKYCSLQSFRFGDSIAIYKDKEKSLTVLILIAASITSSFTLGTMNSESSFSGFITVGVSFITTMISGYQKIKNYPELVDKGMKLASDWRKISNEINLRLNKMDDPESLDKLISEETAVNSIGDLKVENITYTFPKDKNVTEYDFKIKRAMKLLDRCVALKVSGSCNKESVEKMNLEIQRLLDPEAAEAENAQKG